MAHFWFWNSSEGWQIYTLSGRGIQIRQGAEQPLQDLEEGKSYPSVVLPQPADSHDWILISNPDRVPISINGIPLVLGIHVLRDRDEVRIQDFRMYYSRESLAFIESFKANQVPPSCPRCKQRIQDGQPIVCCPQCGAIHHQTEKLPCWTYSERCSLCDQPTNLQSGYRWTPDRLIRDTKPMEASGL